MGARLGAAAPPLDSARIGGVRRRGDPARARHRHAPEAAVENGNPWAAYRQTAGTRAECKRLGTERRPSPAITGYAAGRRSGVADRVIVHESGWVEEDDEDRANKFWWHGETEKLCFDLHITEEALLTEGAPKMDQWWDVSKVAESDHFVAVSKPAGMFVVTDERGLWEESPTNFVHVTHRRFDIPTKDEPRQRGVCHRLDSHTSGIQIVGKSWDSFRHFMTKNTRHKVQKEYLALVCGRFGPGGEPCPNDPGFGLVDIPMKKYQDPSRREFGSLICATQGVPSVTKYKALRQWRVPADGMLKFWGRDRWFTLVQMRILTGRTHQIRMHMAYAGHPLVGDIKYNADMVEEDGAIVPRIFLHCLRMEFEDKDGTTFVAASDLAPDLQAVLCRIQSLSEEGKSVSRIPRSPDESVDAIDEASPDYALTGFPGLARILEDSSSNAVSLEPCADEDPPEAREIRFKCRLCGCYEIARRSLVKRGSRFAMTWKLALDEEKQGCDDGSDASDRRALRSDGWGVGMLWVPTGLQDSSFRPPNIDEASLARLHDELGVWMSDGSEWQWAHDGSRVNGWIRLLPDKIISAKWGRGVWALLGTSKDASPPLLIVAFSGVAHLLRYGRSPGGGAFFEVLAKERVAEDQDLSTCATFPCVGQDSQPCCATRGWPDPLGAGARRRDSAG